jgi:hypothetical protein
MGFQNGWRGPDIVADGLVLYLDAGSPNSYRPDFGTTWKDMSGFNNSGSLINGPTYSSANGGGIVFDGTNDYVTGSLSTSNINEYTLDVWANITVKSTGGSPISTNGTGSQGSITFIQIGGTPNPWQFNTVVTDIPSTGVWYHVVGTQTITTQTLQQQGRTMDSTTTIGIQFLSLQVPTHYSQGLQHLR